MRFSFLLLIVCYQITFAQSETKQKVAFFKTRPNKGKLFIAYGWNRSVYSPSNIHFKGNDYDFTLAKVKASDRQSPFSFDLYFNPSTITIPQVNFKIGIFFHDHYSVSFNIDHMKYVMNQNQKVTISGFNYNPNSYLNGNYDQEFISYI